MSHYTPSQLEAMSYQQLLSHWRHAPAGDPCFQGDAGDLYSKIMADKRAGTSEAKRVEASKKVGW